MKILSIVLLAFVSISVNAQSFFKPKATPYQYSISPKFGLGSSEAGPLTKNFIRPLISVAATFSDGAQLAGGIGASFQHTKSDSASNSWVIQYAASLVAFITSNGSKIGGTGALLISIPGTNGIMTLGPGYDFTNKKVVLATAAVINL